MQSAAMRHQLARGGQSAHGRSFVPRARLRDTTARARQQLHQRVGRGLNREPAIFGLGGGKVALLAKFVYRRSAPADLEVSARSPAGRNAGGYLAAAALEALVVR